MADQNAYEHSGEVTGQGADSPSPQTEHRDTARPTGDRPSELNPEERNRETKYGPRTHQATRIDPDPLFDKENE
jgi:hypothetical protein